MSTPDFFRSRLDAMIDLRHPLAVLATRMPWVQIEAALAPVFARRARDERSVAGEDLFGSTLAVAGGGVSAAGRPRLPLRLMVGLLYLKHAFNESDESVCERWAQDVYFQYFCGEAYFQPRLPCDPTNLVRLRQALDEAGVEELLATTIATAVQMGSVKPAEFERVIVDTTVQEKAIAYPTDSRLLEVARTKLVRLAQRAGLVLKQTYERQGKRLRRQAGGYAHAKQFKRLGRVLKRQRTVLGRLLRDIERKLSGASDERQAALRLWIERAWQICRQCPKDKNKLYALHAPEVVHRGKYKSLTAVQRRWLKRRQAVEPIIGHVKADHGMQRCWLKGQTGDALHAVLCAAGFNLRWLLRAIVRLGLRAVFLCLCTCLLLLEQSENRSTRPQNALAGGVSRAAASIPIRLL